MSDGEQRPDPAEGSGGAGAASAGERRRRLPPRWPPFAYFGVAHASLLAACGGLVLWPELAAGAFYHPRLLAIVHFVTLGWITGAILGSLHLLPAMALRSRVAPHRGDGWFVAVFAIGASGVASHFWIAEYTGMEGSGVMVLAAALWVGWRALPAISRASVPAAVKAHFWLAMANLLLGGGLGVALADDKAAPWIPGPMFGKVFAHAHLLALGWAVMMVMAAGYRLLPMILPSAMPRGRRLWATALLLEGGTLALVAGLMGASRPVAWLGAAAALAAIATFLANVGWMLRRPKPRPRALPRPDLPAVMVLGALVGLALTAVVGAVLLALGPSAAPGLRAAYGVLGFAGFLVPMVLGVAQRLLPWLAWLWGYAERDYRETPPSPYAIPGRGLQALLAGCWWSGTALLAAGAWSAAAGAVRVGAALLAVGAAVSSVQCWRAARVAAGH